LAKVRVASVDELPVESMKAVRVDETEICLAHAEDGSIEAVEDRGRRFTLGVLWHPEEGADRRLFAALVREAAAYREERG